MVDTVSSLLDDDLASSPVRGAIDDVVGWITSEERLGTLISQELVWRELFWRYSALSPELAEEDRSLVWALMAGATVYRVPKVPLNEQRAAHESVACLGDQRDTPFAMRARAIHVIADRHDVERAKVRALLAPGLGFPWMFPRALWNPDVVSQELEATLASFEWQDGEGPSAAWFLHEGIHLPIQELASSLSPRPRPGSTAERMLEAVASLSTALEEESKDIAVIESHSFVDGLEYHGLSRDEIEAHRPSLLDLRKAVVLLHTFQLYLRAEHQIEQAGQKRADDPEAACVLLRRAANVYKRLCVGQLYPERLLERHQEVWREIEELRREASLPERRVEHVLLVNTMNSPSDLQRLLLSVRHELGMFGYGADVHVIVSDDSTGDPRRQNSSIIEQLARAGLSISHWDVERKGPFLDRLNREVFPDGDVKVEDLVGTRKPGEKGIPYGRFRNFLRLAAIKETKELGLQRPIYTWFDQDNAVGALVLTRMGNLARRHVFNYFQQKSEIFDKEGLLVGGGGYTNDALEGVEKFWVAWGVLHHALELAQTHSPEDPPALPAEADITRFRPWDQPETLERLPREGEQMETFADQFLFLLGTLEGTFRGKFDNQVQLYHPWTSGFVDHAEGVLVEDMRPFAGFPGGNTSFRWEILRNDIPYITVGGRGEDIFFLWQIAARHGPKSCYLTHTPALHTRNVRSGRSDLMGEVIDSFNGRLFREPPLVWAILRRIIGGEDFDEEEVLEKTEGNIHNLRAEAKSAIAQVSGYASAIEPYLDEENDFWWLHMGKEDADYEAKLATLRGLVEKFTEASVFQEQVDAKLLGVADVTELADEFARTYPHWKTLVDHLAGPQAAAEGHVSSPLPSTVPGEGYGSVPREAEEEAVAVPERPTAQPPTFVEPVPVPPWQEAVDATMALFRRYEDGLAEHDSVLDWDERVRRLREIFEHYASQVDDMPAFAWTRVLRDALVIPRSGPYLAMTKMLSEEFLSLGAEEKDDRINALADDFGVEADLLREAAV